MPTYEYRCSKCGEDLEVYQTFAEEPLKKHAGCGGKLTKVLSSVGIVLKGSGFYKTDNRESQTSRTAREEASSNGGSDKSSSDKSSSDKGGSDKGGSDNRKAGSEKSSDSSGSSGDSSKSTAASEKKNGAKASGDTKKSGDKKSPVKSA